jgi:licheninase
MNPAHQPTVGMHQTVQLDWFPSGTPTKPSQMQVDWIRVYK